MQVWNLVGIVHIEWLSGNGVLQEFSLWFLIRFLGFTGQNQQAASTKSFKSCICIYEYASIKIMGSWALRNIPKAVLEWVVKAMCQVLFFSKPSLWFGARWAQISTAKAAAQELYNFGTASYQLPSSKLVLNGDCVVQKKESCQVVGSHQFYQKEAGWFCVWKALLFRLLIQHFMASENSPWSPSIQNPRAWAQGMPAIIL